MKRILIFLLIIVSVITISSCDRAKETVLRNTVDNAFVSYETFQDLYNTCQKVNTDLGVYKELNNI